jgi:hypothetical protein
MGMRGAPVVERFLEMYLAMDWRKRRKRIL